MTAQEILEKAIRNGVVLYVQDEELKFRAKSGALTPELKSAIVGHRASIVEHLRRVQAEMVERDPSAPPPLRRRAGEERVPLSYAQQRLWFIDRLGEGSAQYHAQGAHRITGRLDVAALHRALTTIVERHESLRTVVGEENGTPYQVVLQDFAFELPQTDLRHLDDAEQEREVQRIIARNAQQPFDLGRDLMLRVHLLILGEERHVILMDLHHIAADGWSMRVLQEELLQLYPAYCEGRPNPLPPLGLQYADYTMWQRTWLRGEPLDRQLDFWKRELNDIPEVHRLPLDRERPAAPTYAGDAVRCTLGQEALDAIRALCKRHDVTLFMFVHAAVSALLGRYSDDDTVVMGTPVLGRVHPDLESMIGLFVNTIVLKTKLDGDPAFTELLSRNKRTLLDALGHQDVPFEMIVEELKPRRTTSHSPLFQILFNMQPSRPRTFALPGVTFESVPAGSRTSKFDLVVDIIESPSDLVVHFGYSTDIFLRSTIERMAANFRVLVESILAGPDRRVRELDLLAPAERDRLLHARGEGVAVSILDSNGQLMPEGAIGELWVHADGGAQRTGELARWTPEGELQKVGRVEDRAAAGLAAAVPEEQPFVEPRTETEQRMARVWSTVLKENPVGVTENFFGAGGHSLSMVVLIKRIAKEFGVDIPLATFIESPTIEAASRFVDAAGMAQTPAIPALSRERRSRPLPLSFAQTRIWFITRMEEGSSSYNIPAALRFTGPVDRETLRRAFETIVARHTILRTVYREEGREPVQVVLEPRPFHLPLIDLSAQGPDEQARVVSDLVRSESVRAFDLTSEPSLRVVLVRLSEESHVLLFNVHHIAADGWSVGVLTRELNAIYGAYREGRPHTLPELPIQYCDYAVWQRETMSAALPGEHLRFWTGWLAGLPKVHSLPLDRPRPSYPSYRGAHHAMHVAAETVRGLEELSRTHNATMFMVLQAALAVLIHRYSGDTDVAIGTPVANRLHGEVEPLVGCFVNTLVLRSGLAGDPRFTDFLAETHQNLLQAFAHQSVPFELLVEQLNPERDLSHAPLFQVMFAYQNDEGDAIALRDAKFERVDSDYPVSKFDLTLYARRSANGLALIWEYATDIFNAPTIESMASAFGVLLESIVRTPEARVGSLRLLSAEIEQELLRRSAGIPSAPAVAQCIHEVFEARVREMPDAIAVRHGNDMLTYRELDREATLLARRLRARGVQTGDVVGVCAEQAPVMIVRLLAILKAGGAYLPVDPSYPAERLRYLLTDSHVGVVLASRAAYDLLPADVQALVLPGDADAGEEQAFSSADLGLGPRSLAYVLYTSGSTGRPKGVAVEHRGVTRLVCGPDYIELGPDTVTLLHCAMSFDVATFELWAPLLNGGTMVIYDGPSGDVAEMARQVKAYGVNTLWLTSGLMPLWVEQQTPALGLRWLLAGGDVVPPRAVDEIYRRDPRVTIVNGYGPTENTTFSCCHRVPRGPRPVVSIPIGTPIRGSSAYVLDGSMQLLPVGCRGELFVGGDGVAREYVGNPALTSERFVPNPFSNVEGERLYRTGDVVRWLPDGTLEFLGRNDFQVKIRGFRIEIGEIETHLARVEGVAECAVLAIDRDGTGRQLVAYLVGALDATDLGERARRQLRQALPEYMVPAVFVKLDRMPLTPHGKIDRRALPAPSDDDVRRVTYVAPRTSTETAIAGLWQEILRLARVGIDDNFFQIGGHSLLASRFVSAAREAFAVEIPMRVIFDKPTIRELATWFDLYNPVAVATADEPEGEELFL